MDFEKIQNVMSPGAYAFIECGVLVFMPLASKDAGHIVIVLSVRPSVFPSVCLYEVNQILPLCLASTPLARMF